MAAKRTPSAGARPQILFIDAFDSFSNNIKGLLEQSLNAQVTLVHINYEDGSREFTQFVSRFDAVVVGPGPGHPANDRDVGFINELWRLSGKDLIPVLGICLGFQSLCLSQRGAVERLKVARHGIVSRISHNDQDIWKGISDCDATLYHSLHVDIGLDFSVSIDGDEMWKPTAACPSLLPLAWDLSDQVNGPILSSARHITKPFWGVQFHPESICTSEAGRLLIKNWWSFAMEWISHHSRTTMTDHFTTDVHNSTYSEQRNQFPAATQYPTPPSSSAPSPITDNGHWLSDKAHGFFEHKPRETSLLTGNSRISHLGQELRKIAGHEDAVLQWHSYDAGSISPTILLEALGHSENEVVMLDSQGHARGSCSVIGLVVPGKTMSVTYKVSGRILRCGLSSDQSFDIPVNSIEEVWPILQEAIDLHKPREQDSTLELLGASVATSTRSLPHQSPFWGGFMGYISYEAGLETIDVDPHPSCRIGGVPDLNFVFIHRSIVLDHKESRIYVQSLLPLDASWLESVGKTIISIHTHSSSTSSPFTSSISETERQAALQVQLSTASVNRPAEASYRSKVLECQQYLSSGDSYELCLTDETEITLHTLNSDTDEWALYKRLRAKNPAPFGAFVRLPNITIIGSSPERFLSWTRSGRCQFRPIKGTVKKGPLMTREKAHEILGSSKERAENLMIVDLIRHDLSGVVGSANTWVSKLMAVEEYETVYQLVSVIEGQLSPSKPESSTPTGLDVLRASLPPGSMTGAPKKRSCEILRDIEQRPRGVYSGVLGYMDVGGGGDFSVVIRTLVRTKEQAAAASTGGKKGPEAETETWRVGAGGAVTIQSTDEGEFQEMETKASSVLGALFGEE